MPVLLRVGVVQGLAADGAEPLAVLPAQRLGGEREDERVVGPALGVEPGVAHVWAAELLVATGGLIDLTGVDLGVEPRRLQAANTGTGESGPEAEPQRVAAAAGPGDV